MSEHMNKGQKEMYDIELKKQENWGKLIDKATPLLEYFMAKLIKHDAPIAKSTIWGFMILIVLILVSSFILVLWNKLESAGFTFIVGTILGYLLSMAKMFVRRESE